MNAPDSRMLVIVPAMNEQATIAGVVAEVRGALPDAGILVVSDGSVDDTARLARLAGANVLDLPLNLGVGGSMRAGFRYAIRNGYSHAVQIDGDGQHDPTSVPALMAKMIEDDADIVIGARFAGAGDYKMRGPRKWAAKLLAAVISRAHSVKLTDTTSGLKLQGPRALAVFCEDYPAEYLGDTVEALMIAARSRLKVRQVPVTMRPRAGGEPSQGPLKSTIYLLRALVALFISATRPTTRRSVQQAEGPTS